MSERVMPRTSHPEYREAHAAFEVARRELGEAFREVDLAAYLVASHVAEHGSVPGDAVIDRFRVADVAQRSCLEAAEGAQAAFVGVARRLGVA